MALIGELLLQLENVHNKTSVLKDLKTLLGTMNVSDIGRNMVDNDLCFGVLWQCLQTNDFEQIDLSCDVLKIFLEQVEPSVLLQKYNREFVEGLKHDASKVQEITLKQVLRVVAECGQQLREHTDLLKCVLYLVASESCYSSASKILTILGLTPEGCDILFASDILQLIVQTMETSDTVRFRLYTILVDIACAGPECLQSVAQNGLLHHLFVEVKSKDILLQLNSLELLATFAYKEHCLAYMDEQGVITVCDNMLQNIHNNPMAGLVFPGLLRFFGSVAYSQPKSILNRLEHFIDMVFHLLDDNDEVNKGIAIQTIGHIGFTCEGKSALDRLGNKMTQACKQLNQIIRHEIQPLKIKATDATTQLFTLKVADQTSELLGITEKWYNLMGGDMLSHLQNAACLPFLDVQCSSLYCLKALAVLPWAQRIMSNQPGFKEYLIDRTAAGTKECRQIKFDIVGTILASPTTVEIFGNEYVVKLKEFYRQGPHHVKPESSVAFDGDM